MHNVQCAVLKKHLQRLLIVTKTVTRRLVWRASFCNVYVPVLGRRMLMIMMMMIVMVMTVMVIKTVTRRRV